MKRVIRPAMSEEEKAALALTLGLEYRVAFLIVSVDQSDGIPDILVPGQWAVTTDEDCKP